MSNYNKSTNFAVKDTLTSGDPDKVVSGAEIDNEFNSIASAVTSKADKVAAATTDNLAALDANGNLKDSGDSVSSIVSQAALPSGSVTMFAATSAPSGFLECDGSNVSRSTFANLFNAIGTTFGVGDGSTTFGLPDLRGEFIRGWDNGRGVDNGRNFGSDQNDTFQGHNIEVRTFTNGNSAILSGNVGVSPIAIANGGGASFSPDVFPLADTIVSDGTNGTPRVDFETRPRNIALMYIIKT